MAWPRLPFTVKFAVGFSVVFSIAFSCLWGLGFFDGLENSWRDELARRHGENLRPGDQRIVIATMDDAALQEWGLPPSREMHAKLVDALGKLGVKTIGFDIMFLENRPHDQDLIASIKRFRRVVNLFKFGGGSQGDLEVKMPIKGLLSASQFAAHPSIERVIDSDGHLRRVQMFDERVTDPKRKVKGAPLLAAAVYASFTDQPIDQALTKFSEPGHPDVPRLLDLSFRQPREWPGFTGGAYGGWTPYRYVPIVDILHGRLSPEARKALKGSVVLVGSTAVAYFDHYPSPFSTLTPGVESHALALDNALHGDWLKPIGSFWVLLAILAMIWLPVPLGRFPPLVAAGAVFGTLVAWYVGTSAAFVKGAYVEFVPPTVGLLFSFLTLTVHRVLAEGQEKKFIKDLFGQFVAPEVVADLARDPSKVKLGGEKKDLTIFFLDIAHFTNISEKMPPEQLIVFLNRYLSSLTHVIHEHKGVVDKYIGDCIMAFWNAPMPIPDHRLAACLAAIECQDAIVELNKSLDPGVPEVPAIRIGLNSGFATVGLTGSNKKLQYTVIGDEVNLASRLEGANKFFGSKIMASEATYEGAKGQVEARELGPVRVVGKVKPILVYELLAAKGKLSGEWRKALDHYNMGLALFKQAKFGDAALAFQEVVKIFPDDGPANLYLNTSKDYNVIPPDKMPVVFNLTAK